MWTPPRSLSFKELAPRCRLWSCSPRRQWDAAAHSSAAAQQTWLTHGRQDASYLYTCLSVHLSACVIWLDTNHNLWSLSSVLYITITRESLSPQVVKSLCFCCLLQTKDESLCDGKDFHSKLVKFYLFRKSNQETLLQEKPDRHLSWFFWNFAVRIEMKSVVV